MLLHYTVNFTVGAVDENEMLGSYNGSVDIVASSPDEAADIATYLVGEQNYGLADGYTADGEVFIASVDDEDGKLVWLNCELDYPEDIWDNECFEPDEEDDDGEYPF